MDTIDSGYLLINKPLDWTSHDVVSKIRNIIKIKKVGHSGTLDPFATGLLIVLIGKATKMSEKLLNLCKEYVVKSQFDISSDTGDIRGKINIGDHAHSQPVDRADFETKIPEILKINKQIPSKYSAIKINGKKAYKMARAGKDFEMPERCIEIKEFELLDFEYPYFTWRAVVTKGVYIRTLTEQIAALFGKAAITVELKRTKIDCFDIKDSIEINDVFFGMPFEQFELSKDNDFKHIVTQTTKRQSSHKFNRPVITIGSFDGVHLGHQFLLNETVKKAKEIGEESIVLTYPRHPDEIFYEDHCEPVHDTVCEQAHSSFLLTEYEKREAQIIGIGIDQIHYITFDKTLSRMKADDFLKNILVKKFNPSYIVAGYDTHFGVNREGDVQFLIEKSNIYDYQVLKVDSFELDNKIVSSTLIRSLIKNGFVYDVKKYLGSYYSILGTVVKSKQIGRTIGFPTINLRPKEKNKLIPKNGIYFTCMKIDNKLYDGATNIGFSPTLKKGNVLEIETYLLDFSDDVYGKEIELFFIDWIRHEMFFDNVDELTKQIKNDIEEIKKKIISEVYKEIK